LSHQLRLRALDLETGHLLWDYSEPVTIQKIKTR